MALPVRTIVALSMKDEHMDESRINTLITEIQAIEAELLHYELYSPDDADKPSANQIIAKFMEWSFHSTELLNLRLTDLAERVSRIEALRNLPGSADRTESPPAQP
jgi:hypothetical protein